MIVKKFNFILKWGCTEIQKKTYGNIRLILPNIQHRHWGFRVF